MIVQQVNRIFEKNSEVMLNKAGALHTFWSLFGHCLCLLCAVVYHQSLLCIQFDVLEYFCIFKMFLLKSQFG